MSESLTQPVEQRVGRVELIGLLSAVMALGALGVDLVLPAFGDMRAEFALAADSNRVAGVVTVYVLGLAGGTLLFGPLSDRFGRKPALNLGFAIYTLGAVGAALAPSLELVLLSRLVWGVGAAGPRTVSLSIIRDLYVGDRMARMMSFIFAVFIVIPIIAPSLGAGIVAVAPWRWVFWLTVVVAVVVAAWALRLNETMDPAAKLALKPGELVRAARTVLGNRQTTGYMLALTFSFGAFISYLASSQLIVDDILDSSDLFPFIFGGLAAVMGVAMLVNANIVERLGVRRVVRRTLAFYITASFAFLLIALATNGTPSLWVFFVSFAVLLSMHALLIPNTNSVAMDPMGEIAGTAAAVIGAVSTGGGAALGAAIDHAYNGTVTPLAIGFVASSIAAALAVLWADRGAAA